MTTGSAAQWHTHPHAGPGRCRWLGGVHARLPAARAAVNEFVPGCLTWLNARRQARLRVPRSNLKMERHNPGASGSPEPVRRSTPTANSFATTWVPAVCLRRACAFLQPWRAPPGPPLLQHSDDLPAGKLGNLRAHRRLDQDVRRHRVWQQCKETDMSVEDVQRAVREVLQTMEKAEGLVGGNEWALRYAVIDPILLALGWRIQLPWE